MAAFHQNSLHIIARSVVGFVWIYHGAVPKLIFQHADELTIIRAAGASLESAPTIVNAIGVAEILAGIWVLSGIPSVRWPFVFTIVFGVGVTIGAAIQSPQFFVAAFNPLTLNVQMIALSVIGLLSARDAGAIQLAGDTGRENTT